MLSTYKPSPEHFLTRPITATIAAVGLAAALAACGGSSEKPGANQLHCTVDRPGFTMVGDPLVPLSALLGKESMNQVASAKVTVDANPPEDATVDSVVAKASVNYWEIPADGSRHTVTFALQPIPGSSLEPGSCTNKVSITPRVNP